MPQIIAVIGLLLLLSLGGGIGASSMAQPEQTGRVLVSGGETANSNSVTKPTTKTAAKKPTTTKIVTETTTPIVDSRAPQVTTLAAQNISSKSATVRAQVNLYAKKGERVYIVYGYDEKSVNKVIAGYKSYESIPVFNNDKVRVRSVDVNIKPQESYAINLSALVDEVKYFYTYCLEYETGLTCGSVRSFTTIEANYRSNSFTRPSISLASATNVEAYSVDVTGSYKMNDGENGIVFLVYGASKTAVDAVLKESSYADVEEDEGSLQKVRLVARAIGNGSFAYTIDDVDNDTQYFYRVCIEHDSDAAAGVVCSGVRSFTTDRRDLSEKPTATITTALTSGKTVTLSGRIAMNNFNDGHAFFVYGTKEAAVLSVTKTGKFTSIRQSGDSLQLISLDTDVDGNQSFAKSVRDLLSQTTYFYRSCVEYVDQNSRGYETLYLSCSDVKSFTTGI